MQTPAFQGDHPCYCGEFVATPTFGDHRVVSHGTDHDTVRNEAQQKGYHDPVVFFVPDGKNLNITGLCL